MTTTAPPPGSASRPPGPPAPGRRCERCPACIATRPEPLHRTVGRLLRAVVLVASALAAVAAAVIDGPVVAALPAVLALASGAWVRHDLLVEQAAAATVQRALRERRSPRATWTLPGGAALEPLGVGRPAARFCDADFRAGAPVSPTTPAAPPSPARPAPAAPARRARPARWAA